MPPRKREFRPGYRKTGVFRNSGKLSDHRWAWIQVNFGHLHIYRNPPEEEHEELGESLGIFIPRGNGGVALNLTNLTEEELDVFEKFVDLAITTARPMVKHRDKMAREAYANGDDSHVRIYRSAPQFIVRSWPQSSDSESVLNRSDDVSGLGEQATTETDPDDEQSGSPGSTVA